ncbi:glutaredoxin family protein [Pseudokineococcus basanitobsidens]|uniref:Glutaredoxin family protein n=1 Tax=Pseudokineococcus basanitobsidens TaxID=1926649 RepID=A0ABU8RGS2_9ACTN
MTGTGGRRGPLRLLGARRRAAGVPVPGGPGGTGPAGDRSGAPGAVRVVLLGRAGCHLCEAAREVVHDVAARTGTGVREVDVDRPGPGDEPDGAPGTLAARYGELVPVVLVDGLQHAVYHVDGARLEAALRARGR